MIIKLKRKKYALICLLLAVAFVSGCAQKHKEGEPDVISSMKMNQDETLTVVANRKQIEDKDYIAKLKQDGMRNFIKYGVACYKKDCKVMIYEE